MPQMAPMWWTSMFFTFMLSFIFIFMILHFQNHYNPTLMEKDKKLMPKTNWKW